MHTPDTSRKKVEAHNFVKSLSIATVTLVPEKTAAQRVRVFIEQMRAGNYPSDFAYHKTFDYALSLPSIYKLKSTTERLEAALSLLNEVTTQLRQEEDALLDRYKVQHAYRMRRNNDESTTDSVVYDREEKEKEEEEVQV